MNLIKIILIIIIIMLFYFNLNKFVSLNIHVIFLLII